jgi:hypothetical protein
VAGEALVEERVVGAQQVEHVAIVANQAVEQQLGLAAERLAQVVVEVGELVRIGRDTADVAQLQPLAGEVVHQRL